MTNKTLEQIQEENRKAIIMANNPEANSYEEALVMEIKQEGCILESSRDIWKDYFSVNFHRVNNYNKNGSGEPYLKQDFIGTDNTRKVDAGYNKILGKPLTLDRLLLTLGKQKNKISGKQLIGEMITYINESKNKIYFEDGLKSYPDNHLLSWDLTKPTLEEQSEETQREINKLLTESLIS